MLKLNIIPRSIKRENIIFSFYVSLKDLLYIILIILSFYSIIFLILLGIMEIHFTNTMIQTTNVVKNAENFTKKISETNQSINTVINIQKNFVNWLDLFNFLSKNTPDNINFSQIKINKEKNSLTLTGTSETREDLIKLKESLDNSQFLEKIDFPIKNLLEKSNINFTIGAQFKSYEFNGE